MQDFANRVGALPALRAPGGAGARQYPVITPSPYAPPLNLPSCRGSCALQGREGGRGEGRLG